MMKNYQYSNEKMSNKNAQTFDYFTTSCASNQLLKYSQLRFEQKLKKEHEKSMKEYQNGVFKHIRNSPTKLQNNAEGTKRCWKFNTTLLHSAHDGSQLYADEVVGCQFIPGLQHMPGISNNRVEAVADLKKNFVDYSVQSQGGNLSLFALLEQSALASQRECELQKNSLVDAEYTPAMTKYSKPFTNVQSPKSYSAQLSLQYYLKQCRPHSAPSATDKAVNFKSRGKRNRSKSAKVRKVVDDKTAVKPQETFYANILASKPQKPVYTTIVSSNKSTAVDRTSKVEGIDNARRSIDKDYDQAAMPTIKRVSQYSLSANFNEQDYVSKKVDFTRDVITGTETEANPSFTTSQTVLLPTPRGILRKSNVIKSDEALPTKDYVNAEDSSMITETSLDATPKAIQWSKVSYEDGSAAIFDEMGALTIIQEKTESSAEKAEEAGSKGKGKKGKAKKAEKKTESKKQKGKGKKKGKQEAPVVEIEEPSVSRRRKDLGFTTKLLYSIAATAPIAPKDESQIILPNLNDQKNTPHSKEPQIIPSDSPEDIPIRRSSTSGSRRVAWEMDNNSNIDSNKISKTSMLRNISSVDVIAERSISSVGNSQVISNISNLSHEQLEQRRPGILKLK